MNSIQKAFAFTILITIFISCGNDGEKTPGKLTYTENQVGRIIEDCDSAKDCTSIYYYYPVFNNPESSSIIDSINGFVMDKLLFDEVDLDDSADLETVADNFIEDYKLQIKDFPEYKFPWYSKTRASVVYQSDNFLTLKIFSESFTGGAHPNYFTNYFVLSKTTGTEISLHELFIPGFEKELNNIVAKKFRETRDITSSKSLNEEGFWFEDEQHIYNDNFALTENGILFYYNPYDVAPFSMGPTVVEIPYSGLSEIMKK